ncbi:helix-turn-helix domain-containing protein [Mesorhizobium retamae]|uniref:Helix-turn-helix transcriptional regulator n=1 Tax=Mesorhizobium retamae TaxID=2912854 RepID=A0ABS9QJD7_9HYPH|nr:helix-turn-helix transcriptional regulator [Mesorhizobium sp. IRAMC:0171]MCG7507450.1 helix-turn-helix transcriptional regulator [Mesorhizobium sp. IRAMC:0171]
MDTSSTSAGSLIREWRTRRRMSQLDLAMEAEISQRHLSFVESGRAMPSREMVLKLSEQLSVPLRQRNQILLAAGFAPSFGERPLSDPDLAPAMEAVKLVLKGHEPFPALAVDRHWNLVAANEALAPMLAGVGDPSLLQAPVNVLRLSLHPRGVAPIIANLAEWRSHLLERLKQQIEASADPVLEALEEELRAYPVHSNTRPPRADPNAIVHPLRLRLGDTVLSFISTTTVFGTPLDVTLSELAIETFFPADEETRQVLSRLALERAKTAGQA